MSMSPLSEPQRSGIYRAPSDLEQVRRGNAGGRWIELSLRGVENKTDLMSAMAKAFNFPPTFGANWDALADALQDSACAGAQGCVLHLSDSGMSMLPEVDRGTLLDVLSQTAEYWRGHGAAFVVLIDGATELPPWA